MEEENSVVFRLGVSHKEGGGKGIGKTERGKERRGKRKKEGSGKRKEREDRGRSCGGGSRREIA